MENIKLKKNPKVELFARIDGVEYSIGEGDCDKCVFSEICDKRVEEKWNEPCMTAYHMFKKDIKFSKP